MAIEALFFDLDDTLLEQRHPIDWDLVTAHQVRALTPHCHRFGLDHLDLDAVVRRFWVSYERWLPNPERDPNAPLEEVRWREGPAAIIRALSEHGIVCTAEQAVCLWEALGDVPASAFNRRAYADAESTLQSLAGRGFRLAVVTARPQNAAAVERELRDEGISDLFELVVTSGEVGFRKPHPATFESALRGLDLSPERVAFVGDSYENDIVPAAALGMHSILKLNDRSAGSAWDRAGHRIGSLAELLSLELLARSG